MNADQIKRERLLQILVAPQVSEKATLLAEKFNQIVFIVYPDATKLEVKNAIEMLFKVKVTSVQISNCKGKQKRFGRTVGRRANVKKAFISLASGEEINFAEGVA
jgi:large subunit ribosomal protein L23